MYLPKGVITFLYITTLILALTSAYPSKENLKIRIHIPVKHHTHVHVNKVIKKVKVPVEIPVIKEHKEEPQEYKKKHYSEEEEEEDDFQGYDYPKKKRRTRHPFI